MYIKNRCKAKHLYRQFPHKNVDNMKYSCIKFITN